LVISASTKSDAGTTESRIFVMLATYCLAHPRSLVAWSVTTSFISKSNPCAAQALAKYKVGH
jgi:hypothetical protein